MADGLPFADLRPDDAEAVGLGVSAARNGGLRPLHQAQAAVREQAAAADGERGEEAAELLGRGDESCGRGEGAGGRVADRHAGAAAAVRAGVAGDQARRSLLLGLGELRTGLLQAERLEHRRGHVGDVVGAGLALDDRPEDAVADVGVLEVLLRLVGGAVLGHDRAQGLGVRERLVQLPEVGVHAVADRTGGVAEQLADGGIGQRGVRVVVQQVRHGVVEAEAAGLHQLHDRDGGEGLGVAGHTEQVVGGERLAGGLVGVAVGLGEHELVAEAHGHLGAGNLLHLHLGGEPAAQVRDQLLQLVEARAGLGGGVLGHALNPRRRAPGGPHRRFTSGCPPPPPSRPARPPCGVPRRRRPPSR